MPIPNFIIAGPPKTGTTSIFDWLAKHPDAHPSNKKETYFFYDDASKQSPFPNYLRDGWEGYKKLFKGWNREKIVFEASPGYIYSKLALEKLGSIKGLKVLVIYRNEPDRLFSEYQFNKYKTKKFQGDFRSYIMSAEEVFDKETRDETKLSLHTEKWLQKVGQDNLRIVHFDDLKSDPETLMQKLSKFLEIDHAFYVNFDFQKKNETFGLKNRKLHQIALQVKDKTPNFLSQLITPYYYAWNKQGIPKISSDEEMTKSNLRETIAIREHDFKEKYASLFL